MNELASILKSVAPTLASAVLGPASGLVLSALSSKLGVSADPVSLASALANPEQLEKARQLELEWFKLEVQDKDSARKRETEIATSQSSPWLNKAVTPILALVIVTVWGIVQYFMLNHGIPQENRELVARVLGTLDGALMVCLSYYFGASHKH